MIRNLHLTDIEDGIEGGTDKVKGLVLRILRNRAGTDVSLAAWPEFFVGLITRRNQTDGQISRRLFSPVKNNPLSMSGSPRPDPTRGVLHLPPNH